MAAASAHPGTRPSKHGMAAAITAADKVWTAKLEPTWTAAAAAVTPESTV